MTHAEFEALVLPREARSDTYIVDERRDVALEACETRDLPWPTTEEREKMWLAIRRN